MVGTIIRSINNIIGKFIPDVNTREEVEEEISKILVTAEADYIRNIVRLQSQSSGVEWIDAVKHLIRPIITFVMLGRLVSSWLGAPPLTNEEMLIVQGVFAFYFVSRGIEKIIKKIV